MDLTPFVPAIPPERVAQILAPLGGLVWLDGGLEHGQEGRFSFLAAAPVEVREVPFGQASPLSMLDALPLPQDAVDDPAWQGPLRPSQVPCWVGHIAYDAHWSARPGARHPRTPTLPAIRMQRHAALYAFDHARGEAFVVGDDAEAVGALCERLRSGETRSPGAFRVEGLHIPDEADHREAVRRAVAHMRAGDIYQVNLARRLRGRFEGAPLALWLRMRAESPVPLGYFADARNHAVLACTMERFLRFDRDDGTLYTRPIKGTVARAEGPDADPHGEQHGLRSDPKEVAEHSMVVDLMRNDLGHVAHYGSVRVDPLMQVEAFRGLHHLVSTVHATAPRDLPLGTLLEATFPPGSVTGTPKLRAMEIIEALEPVARGLYCGAVGFVDRRGGCSWAVTIRTAVVADGHVDYHTGGGLVVESSPEREAAETVLKAEVFARALGKPAG